MQTDPDTAPVDTDAFDRKVRQVESGGPAPDTENYRIPLAFDPSDQREAVPDDDDIAPVAAYVVNSEVLFALEHAKRLLCSPPSAFSPVQKMPTVNDLIRLALFIMDPSTGYSISMMTLPPGDSSAFLDGNNMEDSV